VLGIFKPSHQFRANTDMSAVPTPKPKPAVIHYPDDDGLPRADNYWQFNWIILLHANLDAQYRSDPNVFVAGNHLNLPGGRR